MKSNYASIHVTDDKKIKAYRIFYYTEDKKGANVMSAKIETEFTKLNIHEQKFLSSIALDNFFQANMINISQDILNKIDALIYEYKANMNKYDGIEIILPYNDYSYQNDDIDLIYNEFVKILDIQQLNE